MILKLLVISKNTKFFNILTSFLYLSISAYDAYFFEIIFIALN